MKRKILIVLTLITFIFGLFSCITILPNNKYQPENKYEENIVKTSNLIANTNVSIVETNSNSLKALGAATIISKINHDYDFTYYAITSKDILININALSVYVSGQSKINITDYAFNDKYNIAIITFRTKLKLGVAKVIEEDLSYDVFIGQTVINQGTDSNFNYPNSLREGIISNNNIEINNKNTYFTHDASNNAGEIGSGVFNLKGYLVGINVNKVYSLSSEKGSENILGLNYSLRVNEIANLFNQLNEIDFNNHVISDLLVTKLSNSEYNKDSYEQLISDVYNDNKNKVVTLNKETDLKSGLLIKKELNEYFVLTAKIEEVEGYSIIVNNKNYLVENIDHIEDYHTSVLSFKTDDELEIYELNNIIEQLSKGQSLVTIGSVNNSLINSLNTGTYSKIDAENDKLFMHSTKANAGQLGSPIFNLNGNLVGINVGKINDITTSDGIIVAEGLTYGYNIEYVINNLFDIEVIYKNYETNESIENQIIEVVNSVINKTVTIKTSGGHGSGVLFKRETLNNDTYLYSVLTNQHVITKRENKQLKVDPELSVVFNFNHLPVRVIDYYFNEKYDMAIVRFTSDQLIEVMESKVLQQIENQELSKGQVVIAIGTPEDSKRIGYVTTGILSRDPSYYNTNSKLGLIHTASLNPGNSGGALFDLKGNLIGINVAKSTSYPSLEGQVFSEGVGISLNINVLAEVYNSVLTPITYRDMPDRSPRIGITVTPLNGENGFKDVYPNYGEVLHDSANTGIVIVDVDPLFDVYGKLELYDNIIAIDGVPINNNEDVPPLLSGKPMGTKLLVTVLRKGNAEPLVIEVKLS